MHLKKTIRRVLVRMGIIPEKGVKRNDVRKIDIQENLYCLVYWKVLRIGRGPAVTVNAFGKEILKFDCFGKERGHYHIYPYSRLRVRFVESNASEQVHRVHRELIQNMTQYLGDYPNKEVQRIQVDSKKLELTAIEVRETMLSFLRDVEELQGI